MRRLLAALVFLVVLAPVTASAAQPTFPIRAAFVYPWYPETWGDGTHYSPTLGHYDSSSGAVIVQHIAWMQQAHIDAGIASWWGPGTPTDQRIGTLEQRAKGTGFKWTLYYEDEGYTDPSVATISGDLTYIAAHYDKGTFLHVGGKPVIFVYAGGNDGCGMASRWVQANRGRFYVVLKVFGGFTSCAAQPQSWHQYAPASATQVHLPWSYAISPGFWFSKETSPRLVRSPTRFKADVASMVASGADWQLVTTFNEWGEGTAIEPATQWATTYLDILAHKA